METTRLSSKGQVILPMAGRDARASFSKRKLVKRAKDVATVALAPL
jgi:hypothetical protein